MVKDLVLLAGCYIYLIVPSLWASLWFFFFLAKMKPIITILPICDNNITSLLGFSDSQERFKWWKQQEVLQVRLSYTNRIEYFHFRSQILTLVHDQLLWEFSLRHWTTTIDDRLWLRLLLWANPWPWT